MNIHHWFIPTNKNRFHPHVLRTGGLLIFLALFVAIPLLYNVTSVKQFKILGYATNVSVGELHTFSNQERINAGLAPLVLDSNLNSAALAKANHMMSFDYWAHVAPDGTTPWSFISASGYNYSAAGENLAKDFTLSIGVVSAWMGSQLHRDNIMNGTYQDVGYAVVNGTLLGSETTLVVAMYGAKTTVAVTAPAATVQTPHQPTITPVTNEVPANPVAITEPVVITPTEDVIEPIPVLQTQTTKDSDKIQSAQPAIADNSGNVEGVTITASLKAYNSLNWGQKTSILLMSTLILLFIMKHTLIWRQQKRGARSIWLRSHPLGQATILLTVFLITIFSGVGVIL